MAKICVYVKEEGLKIKSITYQEFNDCTYQVDVISSEKGIR